MKRRSFLKTALPATLASGFLLGCRNEQQAAPGVVTQPHIDWRLASSFPRSLDTLYGAGDFFCKRLAEMTDNRFRIRIYPAGELVPGLQVMDAVQQGSVQVGQTAGYYYTGKNPALAFETTVPFGLTMRQQIAWLTKAGGYDELGKIFSDFNIIPFYAGGTGAQMGGWFRREIPDLKSLHGLKMRIPGLGGEIMSRLGVTVQVLAGSDIYMALERGAIDATEWVGPHDDEKLGFHKIAKNYYYPGWWEPGAALSLYVNRSAWDQLPSSYQAAFKSANAEAALRMLSSYDEQNPVALARLLDQGVQLKRFSDDTLQEAERLSFENMEEHAAKDATYARIYAHWKKFRTDSFRWFNTAEQPYQAFAFPRG
ncbi:MAG: TRAP transporter substrate-binding protein [Verrucomicrobia bacterium]|nr:TRAP transporter substrate-binding protein [Kiritimatiellia bacterium]MCO6399795.1 TRAP transporter substrate-binding protein [Verrucomicrobiota bacterium]